jgi:integrase
LVEILAPGKVKLREDQKSHERAFQSRHAIRNLQSESLVRQSAKRKSVPVILSANEVQRLLSVLGVRENTLVLLAFGTGLRMSELFGLKWHDTTFRTMRSASLVPSCSK